MNELLNLALKYNINDRTRSILTVITVSIAALLVIIIIIITQSGVNFFFSELLTFQPDQLVILPIAIQGGGAASGIKFFDMKDYLAVRSLECISRLYPTIISRAEYNYKNRTGFVSVVGSDEYLNDNEIYISIMEGRRIDENSKRMVVVGYRVWKNLDVKIGDSITLDGKQFRVIGILEKSTFQSTDDQVFISLSDARELFGNRFNSLIGRFDLNCDENGLIENIKSILRRGGRDITVISSQFIKQTIGTVLDLISFASIVLSFVASIIASFGITNTILASLIKRRKQIAVMKTIGASDRDIIILIIFQISILVIAGIVLAVIIASLLTIYLNNFIPVYFKISDVIINMIILYLVSVTAPIILGSRDIFRISPVEALRE
ncbi:MAG: ABC transporter permease [Candidatus Anstonellales archaeon]